MDAAFPEQCKANWFEKYKVLEVNKLCREKEIQNKVANLKGTCTIVKNAGGFVCAAGVFGCVLNENKQGAGTAAFAGATVAALASLGETFCDEMKAYVEMRCEKIKFAVSKVGSKSGPLSKFKDAANKVKSQSEVKTRAKENSWNKIKGNLAVLKNQHRVKEQAKPDTRINMKDVYKRMNSHLRSLFNKDKID